MIHPFGHPDPPVPRLMQSLASLGHRLQASSSAPAETGAGSTGEPSVLVMAAGTRVDPLALGVLFQAWRRAPGARLLVLSALGAHPDAKASRLRQLWDLEEACRSSGLPAVVLRLAPLLGPESPFWIKLRTRPRLPWGMDPLFHPVAERLVVDALDRALRGQVSWQGWYEVAGEEIVSLRELIERVGAWGPRLPSGLGAWEPPLGELREHRLAEPAPWLRHFGVQSRPLEEEARAWAA